MSPLTSLFRHFAERLLPGWQMASHPLAWCELLALMVLNCVFHTFFSLSLLKKTAQELARAEMWGGQRYVGEEKERVGRVSKCEHAHAVVAINNWGPSHVNSKANAAKLHGGCRHSLLAFSMEKRAYFSWCGWTSGHCRKYIFYFNDCHQNSSCFLVLLGIAIWDAATEVQLLLKVFAESIAWFALGYLFWLNVVCIITAVLLTMGVSLTERTSVEAQTAKWEVS